MKTSTLLAYLLLSAGLTETVVAYSQPPSSFHAEPLRYERLPDLHVPRFGHAAFYAGGELVVAGGHTSGFVPTATAERLSDGQWHTMDMVYAHDNGLCVVMSDGRILLAGGHSEPLGIGQTFTAETYDPATQCFNGFGCLNRKRALASGLEMDSGRVVIAGNYGNNDAIELFDGRKHFSHVKEMTVAHVTPRMLRSGADDAIVFGSVWRNGEITPCDTVDRLRGEPFTEPLLRTWMPIAIEQNISSTPSRISGDGSNEYAHLVAAFNRDGQVGILHIQDTVFSLLPTVKPIPTHSPWGEISYISPALTDRERQRAYLVGTSLGDNCHIIVLQIDYGRQPAPLKLYCMKPDMGMTQTRCVMTPDGDIVLTGGINSDNFSPLSTVYLLHLATPMPADAAQASAMTGKTVGCLLLAVLVVIAVLVMTAFWWLRKRRKKATGSPSDSGLAMNKDSLQLQEVCRLIEDRQLFLNSDLKVGDIADLLGVHRNYVSDCINSQAECSFAQLVNRYRVEHAQQLLVRQPDMKIASIATESGFANETSFFRTFKAATGTTPREWVAANAGK